MAKTRKREKTQKMERSIRTDERDPADASAKVKEKVGLVRANDNYSILEIIFGI